jgi:hypothetical protein
MLKKLLYSSLFSICSFTAVLAQIPNPGFETWTTQSGYKDPSGWGTINSSIASFCFCAGTARQTTTVHSGTYAMQLITVSAFGQTAPGIAATGTINTSTAAIDGGLAYTLRPDSVTGWFKYTPAGADTGTVDVTLSKWNTGTNQRDVVGHARFETHTTVSSYTRFAEAFAYSSSAVPDTMVVILLSSIPDLTSANVNSTLFLDDLDLVQPANTASTSIAITSGASPMCEGSSITFTATVTNGGTTPTYQWKVNGADVSGATNATFTSTTLASGDAVTCVMTSNLPGVVGSPATSNAVSVIVNAIPNTPVITQNGSVLTSSLINGNQWHLNGTLISGATGHTYTVTQVGTYTVIATVSGCSSPASAPVNVAVLGVNQLSNDVFFNVYPNPTDGNFDVVFNVTSNATYKIELKNALGQLVYQETVQDFTGGYSQQLNMSEYGKGIYTVSLTNTTNSTSNIKKVVVY